MLAAGIPLAGACLLYSEWRLGPAEGGFRELGRLLLGDRSGIRWNAIRDESLALAVKGFFLPINFCELADALRRIRCRESAVLDLPWPEGHALALTMIYALIIAAVTPGYLFHARLFRTEVRKVDATWFGWTVTLCCYAPFVTPVFHRWFDYRVACDPGWRKPWIALTGHLPWLAGAAGALIILSELLHYWGECQFGIRSSNLTHRGIITDGPYRWCKHPVYVTKCVGWALIWLPFLAGGAPQESLRLTLLFSAVCGIYLLRGVAEERLLSADPDYVAYALWIDRHGLFARIGRLIPPLSFRWRLARWEGDRSPPRG
jgi:protein-S-isoprenylcysteine O-methyltransferase Ste14